MSELGYVIRDTKERKIATYIIGGISLAFIFICVYKLSNIFRRFEKTLTNVLLVMINSVIFLIFLGSF
jgi:hypothetical protein